MPFILNQIGKITDDLWIFEITSLGSAGHLQVLFHQPGDQFRIAGRQL